MPTRVERLPSTSPFQRHWPLATTPALPSSIAAPLSPINIFCHPSTSHTVTLIAAGYYLVALPRTDLDVGTSMSLHSLSGVSFDPAMPTWLNTCVGDGTGTGWNRISIRCGNDNCALIGTCVQAEAAGITSVLQLWRKNPSRSRK